MNDNSGGIVDTRMGESEPASLARYAEDLSILYAKRYGAEARKTKGQFFTPSEISSFMAGLFEISEKEVRILDPGAGTGNLIAAFCDRLLDSGEKITITADLYENDPTILPFLKKTLATCKTKLAQNGKELEYNIHSDFLSAKQNEALYDLVICNPPYYKIKPPEPEYLQPLNAQHPNMYALFMGMAIDKLKPSGEAVFITPRSFCSGTYYGNFRERLLAETSIKDIHIFESRKEVFHNDGIIQESIIVRLVKGSYRENSSVRISVSANGHLEQRRRLLVNYGDVVHRKRRQTFIRIPTSYEDVKILHVMDKWQNTLADFDLEISTGPVVDFRAKEHLLREFDSASSAPLLWMHNLGNFKVEWPAYKNGKPIAILINSKTRSLVLPARNYVLIKRFSSKEQPRRLYAVPFLKSDFDAQYVGIENHVNYVHKIYGEMGVFETLGIAALLNTAFVDRYFRALNGNTQVNAMDIRHLSLPGIEDINEIGRLIKESKNQPTFPELNSIVSSVLKDYGKVLTVTEELA